MSIEVITILLFACFGILLLTGLPLAWVMGATAVIFTLILFEPRVMTMMVSRIYSLLFNYALVAVPLFLFMGNILDKTGVAENLFDTVYVWFGRVRGGLAVAAIIACAILAAMIGVVGAEIVTIGLVALPTMFHRGYDKNIALGSITAGGGLASLIPPSVVFILYAMIAGVSIGEMYMAGVVPGLLAVGLYVSYVLIRCWLNPALAPAATDQEGALDLGAKLSRLKGLVMPMALIVVVMGSIYAGVATATEAGGLGCAGAIICGLINRRLTWRLLGESLYSTICISAMIVWLLFGSQTIIGVYALAGGDEFVKSALTATAFGKWGTIIIMQLIWIVLGCLLDWIGILMLTMPLFLPVVASMDVNLIWFGVLFCANMMVSYITPPFGPACFYLKGVTPPHITLENIFRANFPFVGLNILVLILLMAFPELALWLPRQMAGN